MHQPEFGKELSILRDSLRKLISEKKIKESELYETVSKFIIRTNHILTTYDNEQMYLYENGYYRSLGESKIKEQIQEILQENTTINRVHEILNAIKRCTYIDRDEFDKTPKNLICLKNGIFDLERFELLQHSPDFYFISQIPIEYNQNAKCPKIQKFVSEVVQKDKIGISFQIIAYCLYRGNPFQKAFMFVGSGRNGKSKFIDLINTFVGSENCSNIELQEIEESRFSTAHLYGKHVNSFADLPQRALKGTGKFKTISGGDTIQADKKFKDSFSFKPYCKLVFSANLLPISEDDTDAFYRRWIILVFPNEFEGDKDNKNILQEITGKSELEGLLILSLKQMYKMLQRGSFKPDINIEENRKLYTKLSDPIGSFIMDKIEISSDHYCPKQQLYNKFIDYCRANRYPILSEKSFSKGIITTGKVEEYRANIDKERVRCWSGIRYVSEQGESDITRMFGFPGN